MSKPINEYALIGDCETGALVALDGSIDWLCWPRFDSEACFAALLGTNNHGRWLLAPEAPATKTSRSYRGNTLVLDTVFETPQGSVIVTDFMPIRGSNSDLVRIVRCSSGIVRMTMDMCLRFDYGRTWPWQTRLEDGRLRAIAGPSLVQLETDAPWTIEDGRIASSFTLAEGEERYFTLTYSPSHLSLPEPVQASAALKATIAFLGGLERTVFSPRAVSGYRSPIPYHVEGTDLSSDGRHCCCTHNLTAGTPWGRAKLGLPLLLAA